MIISPDNYLHTASGEYVWTKDRAKQAWAISHRKLAQVAATGRFEKMVMLVGLPASGKSTWLKSNHEASAVYFDATFTKAEWRAEPIRIAREAGMRVEAIVMDTPINVCLERNACRPEGRAVPEEEVRKMQAELLAEPPKTSEGIDSIRHVRGRLAARQNPRAKQTFKEWMVGFDHPRKGDYEWTGSGLKPGYLMRKVKTFSSKADAEREIRDVVLDHIINYKSDFEPFISGWPMRTAARVAARWIAAGATGPYEDSVVDGMKVTQVTTDNTRSSVRLRGNGILIKWGLDATPALKRQYLPKWVRWGQRQLSKKQDRIETKKEWTRTVVNGYSVYDLDSKEEVAGMLATIERDIKPILREFGLSYQTMKESVAEGSLGFNRGGRTIALNIRQKRDPMKLRKYSAIMSTMIHELAHLRHMNHGPGFKAFEAELKAWARSRNIYQPG